MQLCALRLLPGAREMCSRKKISQLGFLSSLNVMNLVGEKFMIELFFQEIVLGSIEIISKEQYWNDGKFTPYANYKNYTDFFEALVNEDGFDETKFDPALLDDKNWYVKDDGRRMDLCIPAIYEDLEISFRYR